MGEYRLEMKDISKEFPGVKALDGVTLRVRPGSVHALMGENGAGKSTLMKCLFGIYHQDQGEILLDGQPVNIPDSKTALGLGISMIHQELHPVPYRSVMENIWMGRMPTKGVGPFRIVNEKEMFLKTAKLLKELELTISPKRIVSELSVSSVQLMEIAKAVSYNSRVIIMDEPTSSLTENEVQHLFKIIRRERDKGTAIIYISHKMEEILSIADEVTIMRDGQWVGTWPSSELSTDLIISRMVGRDLKHRFPPMTHVPLQEYALQVEGLSSMQKKSFKDVTFGLRRGEILGVGGLVGAQRTELVEALFGLRPIDQGQIIRNGKPVAIRSPQDAKAYGLALLTEDRRSTGIIPMLSVLDNGVIANQAQYTVTPLRVLSERKRVKAAEGATRRLRVKTPSLATLIKDLSGGNQQKVLIARWLLTEPEILIMDEPTRGIDVGAKYEIYTIMEELAQQGKSIIMISSEMPELLGMSDRIMVMREGRLSGIIDGKTATQVQVMQLASLA